MCKDGDEALKAHAFAKDVLRTLNLDIHALGAPGSKSRIGNFSKDGLNFLGIRFEGRETFPTAKAVKRFREKVDEVLVPASGLSLFRTLQRLTNLMNGWGKAYKDMHVARLYLELDDFVKTAVVNYLEKLGVRLIGKNKRKQMKLLGVPSLSAMIEHARPLPGAPLIRNV
jgi:hypothetical protein